MFKYFFIISLIALVAIICIAVKLRHNEGQQYSCLQVRKQLLAKIPKGRNTYIPQCALFGGYLKQQCNPSTKECWCVGINGLAIEGTWTSAGKQPSACRMNGFEQFYSRMQQ